MNGSPGDCYLHGIGTAVPRQCLAQDQTQEVFAPAAATPRAQKLMRRVARLTGVERRHLAALDFVGDSVHAPLYRPIACQPRGPGMSARTAAFDRAAAPLVRNALSVFSSPQLSRVTNLLTVTCTHAAAPGLEQHVLACSPVPRSVQRWNLGFMGCSAVLAAIRLIHRGRLPGDSLIVACELSSLHFQYTDELDQLTANLLFADGCAAAILSSRASPLRIIGCACATIPECAAQMTWLAGDHGLQLRLSPELPETLSANLKPIVDEFLASHEALASGIDHWIVHPGGPQILDSVQQSLGLPAGALERSRNVLSRYGNMSSPTVLFILGELLERRAHGRAVMIAFGPGLTVELVMLDLSER